MSTRPTVTRIEPFGRGGLKVRVYVDQEGAEALEVALEAVERARLGVGDLLDTPKRRTLLGLDADVRVREAALSLLSYRARTRAELARRLRRKGFEGPRIDACLQRLEERGLLDDEGVCAAFVRDRLRHRPKGKSALRAELRAKGVAPGVADGVVDDVFEAEDVTDTGLAGEAAEAWVTRQSDALIHGLVADRRTPERQRAERRLRGYLGRRGFRGDALRHAMERARVLAEARSAR